MPNNSPARQIDGRREQQHLVYYGKCEAQGPKIVSLKSVLAAEDGTGRSTSKLPMSTLSKTPTEQRHEGFFIQVLHPNAEPAACVDLPSQEESGM